MLDDLKMVIYIYHIMIEMKMSLTSFAPENQSKVNVEIKREHLLILTRINRTTLTFPRLLQTNDTMEASFHSHT